MSSRNLLVTPAVVTEDMTDSTNGNIKFKEDPTNNSGS
jgi:hypothetical protein